MSSSSEWGQQQGGRAHAGRFWLLRHGETADNRRGVRCGGDVDVPLTPRGEQQARSVALQLAGLGVGLIVAAPLLRTRGTAEIVAAALGGIPVMLEPLFVERALGAWNGRPIAATEPLLRSGQTPPGGESEAGFRARIERALDALRPLLPRRPLVVSSKGVARVLGAIVGATPRPSADNAELITFTLPAAED